MTSTIDAPRVTESAARHLVCRGCGAQFPLAAQHACYECFGPLEVGYDPDALKGVTREQVAAGPHNIWRYAPLGAVGGAVLLQILSSILDQITALGSVRSYLPTHYAQAWLGLLSNPAQTDDVVKGCVSAVIYGTLFFGAAWWRFLRKDIVS